MIKQMVGKFGRFRKISKNVYDKTTADVIKVLVEVEDISVIPKIMHCSYKSLTDDKIRSYAVSLESKGKSLPMSEIDKENWEQTLAASGRSSEVADWREEDLITTAENANAQGMEEEGVNVEVDNEEQVAEDADMVGEAVNEPVMVGEATENQEGGEGGINMAEGVNQGGVNEGGVMEGFIAMMEEGEEEKEEETLNRAGAEEGIAVERNANLNSNLNSGEANAGGPSNYGRAAIAKGKRPMIDGPDMEKFKNRLLRPFSNSGSDSFDPDKEIDIHGPEPGRWNAVCLQRGGTTGSEDEVSVTGGKTQIHERVNKEEEKKADEEEDERQEEGSEEVESVRVQTEPQSKGKQKLTATKRRVPPPQPFGLLQKGGFSFGKRARSSSASSKSGSKQGTNHTTKAKSRPINSLHDEFIAEVSRNVGLKKPLSKKQIGEIKSLEKARSSR